MSRYDDPLGLTPEQRTLSNIHAGLGGGGGIWWPPKHDPRVIDGELVGEPDDSLDLIAHVLHGQGLELMLALMPREERA